MQDVTTHRHGTKVQKGKFVPERYLFRGKHRRSRRMPKDIRKRWIPLDSPLRADKIVRKKGRRYEVQAMTHTYSPAEFKALLGEVDGKGRASPNPPRPAEAKMKAGKLEYKA